MLWALAEPRRLSARTRAILVDPDNLVFVSVASAWEISIKRTLGKLRAPSDLSVQIGKRRFTELPVMMRHIEALDALPPLHRDPFDRILVAQAACDRLVVVTADAKVRAYAVETLSP